ncbi:unnamed protein product [Toxocara canis]|uniref:Nuclear pore complex protein Nup85 n=1 Tax=Toxocara canis TaxID=6265 RepID=A0A183UQZ3_TOXCA|nr:unnamed protein product [Toxocara canis]
MFCLDGSIKGELLRAVSLKNADQRSLTHPAMQTLIHESYCTPTFSRAQKLAKEATIRVDDLRLLSLEYRSALRGTQSSLGDEDSELRETLNVYELIWSLAESIFINPHVSSIVVDVAMWSQVCLARTTYADEKYKNGIIEVAYFVLSGLFSSAAAFLESYATLTDDAAIAELSKLIANINIALLNDANTQIDFINQQKAVRDLCDSGRLWGKGEAEKIALIVSGDPSALKRISGLLDSWFELMPAYLMFLRPCATLSDLHEIVQECMKMHGSQNEGSVDEVMSTLFSLDSLRALQLICTSSPDWWLSAHLADLLYKCDPRTTTAHGVDARQFILIEYAKSLFAEPGMWRVAVDYLLECGEEGCENLALLIETMPIDNEKTAIALSGVCAKASLRQIASDVAKTMAYKLLREEHWGSALSWAMRSGDPSLTSMVADQIAGRCSPETVSTIGMLAHLSAEMVQSPSLLFLHKYHSFRNSLMEGAKGDAAALLVDLITSDFAPRKFRPVLFTDLIAILSYEDEIIVDKEATLNMIQYLNRNDAEQGFGVEQLEDENMDELSKKCDMLRYALLNNLANAIAN